VHERAADSGVWSFLESEYLLLRESVARFAGQLNFGCPAKCHSLYRQSPHGARMYTKAIKFKYEKEVRPVASPRFLQFIFGPRPIVLIFAC
jgi:hypothetical protein